jgi:hypothetical protein
MFEFCMIILKNNTQDMSMGKDIATETDTDIDTDAPTLLGQF